MPMPNPVEPMTKAQRERIALDYAVMYAFLRRIAAYMTPQQLEKRSDNLYGLPYEEALEMAYDNVLQEAKTALKSVHKPFVPIESAEEIVKAKWPDAQAIWTSRGWRVISEQADGLIGRTDSGHVPEQDAWQDAARRIAETAKKERE